MNLPKDINEEVSKAFKDIREHLKFTEKTVRSIIIGPTGNIVWEESEENYQSRLNEMFYEIK